MNACLADAVNHALQWDKNLLNEFFRRGRASDRGDAGMMEKAFQLPY